jgi:NTP pyrophosphatase (non-canonical NTP hydrolase)
MAFEQLEIQVIGWAADRGIYDTRDATSQLLKAVSEIGELADADLKDDQEAIADAVGDVIVCLINYCYLREVQLTDCLDKAYNQIKDRTGTILPSGVFQKD